MRVILVVAVQAVLACGGRDASGPPWPKSAGTEIDPDEEDGGESLEPRESAGPDEAVESSETAEPAKPATPDARPKPDGAPKPDAAPKTDAGATAPRSKTEIKP